MRILNLIGLLMAAVLALVGCSTSGGKVDMAEAAKIDRAMDATLQNLYRQSLGAQGFAQQAVGVLVCPDITRAGFIGAADYGKGARRKRGRT